MPRIHLPPVLAGLSLLCGCSSISSYNDGEDDPRNGIVYYLPKTEYEVTFNIEPTLDADPVDPAKKIQKANIDIACIPLFVVDKSVGAFTLHSSANEFFTRDHKVRVNDGLLTSVSVNDDGRIAEISKKLGDAVSIIVATTASPLGAIDFIEKGGPGAHGGGGGDEFKASELPDIPELEVVSPLIERNRHLIPSQIEIASILMELTPGVHKWHLKKNSDSFQLQGASGRVSASMSTGGGGVGKSGPASSLRVMPARECGVTPGLVTRNTTKGAVTINLEVEEGMVAELRRAAASRNVTKLKNNARILAESALEYSRERNDASKRLELEEKRINPLGQFPGASANEQALKRSVAQNTHAVNVIQNRIRLVDREIDQYQKLVESYQVRAASTQKILLKQHSMTVSRTVDERAVVIPLKRGPVGVTTHSVKLDRGVINDWDFTRQSAIEGLIQIPINLASSIIGIPAKAFENQTTTAKNEAKLAEARTEQIQAEIDLLKKQLELEEAKEKSKNP